MSHFKGVRYAKGIDAEQWRRLFGFNGQCFMVLLSLEQLREKMTRRGEFELSSHYLTPPEQDQFLSFTFAKRKLEWLGGRLAAKYVAMEACGRTPETAAGSQKWRDWTIETDKDGRPHINHVGKADKIILPDISISHNNGLAAAMAAIGGRCGLDIQKIVPSVLKVKERFASAPEQDILRQLPDAGPESARLTLLWSAKEAVKKAVGANLLPGFMGIRLAAAKGAETGFEKAFILDFISQVPGRKKRHNATERLKVAALFYHEFALAFTGLPDKHE